MMAWRKTVLFLILLVPSLPVPCRGAAEAAQLAPTTAQAEAATWAARFLTRYHYRKLPLDDAMSQEILARYLEALDGDRLFLTAADTDEFARLYGSTLDDAIYDQAIEPPYTIFARYRERVVARLAHVETLLAEGFRFDVEESYAADREDAPWSTPAALDEHWRKRLKNEWLQLRLAGRDDAAVRKTLERRYRGFGERVAELDGQDVFQTFVNAYAGAIEPHTGYMGPRSAENFAIQMKLSLEGIGALLGREDDYTVIREVTPGGPLARDGRLEVGDRIVGVGQGESGKTEDVVGWRLDDVVERIRGPKGSVVLLDVLPHRAGPDARPERVRIVRDTVKFEEQAAQREVITIPGDDGERRIGVVSLPVFYRDFDGAAAGGDEFRSATRDVAVHLKALAAEGVDGVVLDLRDNGGGSLVEAVELAGLFIDQGPVVQVRDAEGRISVESDTEAGAAWDGPLAVLVNRASASASEIVAAALQDYGRALVIGATTYGKGTVQGLVDLDRLVDREEPRYGQLRLTMAQYFRVDGGSTQNRGVEPDITLPDVIDPETWGESAIDNALPWSAVPAARYPGYGSLRALVPVLTTRHEARVAKDAEFQEWQAELADLEALRAQRTLSLHEPTRRAERDALDARRKARGASPLAALERETDADDAGDGDAAARADGDVDADAETPSTPERPDVLRREAARVLADAIAVHAGDRRLAARLPGFAIADTDTRVN